MNELRDELRVQERPGQSDPETTELERALVELRDALTGAAQQAEDAIAEHPTAAVASAFVLGLVLGRLSGVFR